MDLQFSKIPTDWLRPGLGNTKIQEQTLEVRLTDDAPDIGKVICAWGQPLLRSKQWNRGSAGVSGGVMAWVLYQSAQEGTLSSVACWVPFQTRWEIPEGERDGVLLANCYLQGVEARTLSARKLMVRCSLGLTGQTMTPVTAQLPQAGELPEDVQILKKTWDVLLPREAGEKMVSLEESLDIPEGGEIQKILYYCLHPQISDCKLMADRAVFRGSALCHVLYQDSAGVPGSWDFTLPFSQFTELEREYGEDDRLLVTPQLAGLEMEVGEKKLTVKASLLGQYLVLQKNRLETVMDAYSLTRKATLQTQELLLPWVTEILQTQERAEAPVNPEGRGIDCACFLAPPRLDTGGGELAASFQLLSASDTGYTAQTAPWQTQWSLPGMEDGAMFVWLTEQPQLVSPDKCEAQIGAKAMGLDQMHMLVVSGMTLGEERESAPDRPSMILRRAQNQSLWQLAKEMGTTTQAILDANGLSQMPPEGSWLLIPVP